MLLQFVFCSSSISYAFDPINIQRINSHPKPHTSNHTQRLILIHQHTSTSVHSTRFHRHIHPNTFSTYSHHQIHPLDHHTQHPVNDNTQINSIFLRNSTTNQSMSLSFIVTCSQTLPTSSLQTSPSLLEFQSQLQPHTISIETRDSSINHSPSTGFLSISHLSPFSSNTASVVHQIESAQCMSQSTRLFAANRSTECTAKSTTAQPFNHTPSFTFVSLLLPLHKHSDLLKSLHFTLFFQLLFDSPM
uniref:Uncharacterized protein n=1 Tax=Timspurckia oligopyrenoides TaxID=708627 RepID=A0A7S1ETR6_9RHOD|mmetsp:Transcript_7042/g.12617  ORF Transcript_7042/g.12617 Transcript_7042/m.12617 type:complete len:246 (+) Transcript_7042:1242-1979(+)